MPRQSLPPNTRINRRYVEFRKLYKGRSIVRTWPLAKRIEAEQEIYKLLARIKRNEDIAKDWEGEVTISEACETYWHMFASKKGGKTPWRPMLDRIKQFMGSRLLHTVTHEDVEDFLHWLRNTKFSQERFKNTEPYTLSANSINKHHATLTSLFKKIRFWVEVGKIKPVKLPKQANPGSLVQKNTAAENTRIRVLSYEEYERLIQNSTPALRAICDAAIFTLLRKKDLMHLHEKQATESRLAGIQFKTGKGFEIANIGRFIGKLDFTNFRRSLASAAKKAHIKDFQFRDLRRTGATWLFRKTNDLGLVQKRLGHASPAMTKKYLGIMLDDDIRASEVLGSILSGFGEKLGEKTARVANPIQDQIHNRADFTLTSKVVDPTGVEPATSCMPCTDLPLGSSSIPTETEPKDQKQ